MRIREPFAIERASEVNEYRKKYFIVSEGAATEPKYFEKLNESVERLIQNLEFIKSL